MTGSDWHGQLAEQITQFRAANHMDDLEARVRAAVLAGTLTLPYAMTIRCPRDGAPLLKGHLAELPAGLAFTWLADEAAKRGVSVSNGNRSRDRASRTRGVGRWQIPCPNPTCTYSPQVYSLRLDAFAMVNALVGEPKPLFKD